MFTASGRTDRQTDVDSQSVLYKLPNQDFFGGEVLSAAWSNKLCNLVCVYGVVEKGEVDQQFKQIRFVEVFIQLIPNIFVELVVSVFHKVSFILVTVLPIHFIHRTKILLYFRES